MSDRMKPPCLCPRSTARIEKELDKIDRFVSTKIMTSEMQQYREILLRKMEVAQARPGPMEPVVCVVCGGVRE